MGYQPKYYDLVLGGVFVAMGLGVAVGTLTDVPVTASVTGFALVAVAIIGHALFVNGPVDEPADLTDEVDELV